LKRGKSSRSRVRSQGIPWEDNIFYCNKLEVKNGRKQRKTTEKKGAMTVAEAGRKGGRKTADTHGHEFYQEIGHKGGQRVRELIEEGKRAKSLKSR
jgi:general stress protein YciG